ncbi:MAG TPA: alpha-L-rhamnosidase, partial [Porphyromonadaceae bacterium]|nr:alpha-L-rhamnosidase [Porphyromonadaceae bacterium]
MTDLLKHTGTVFVGGYPSSIPLWQQDKAIEPANSTRIHSSRPLFGWLVPDNGKGTLQTAYRIIVSDSLHHATKGRGTIWDSGTVASDKSVAASYQGETLHPNTVYYWRVKTVTNTGGESEWSDVAAFRTGDQLQPYRHSGELLVKDVDKPLTQSDPDTG